MHKNIHLNLCNLPEAYKDDLATIEWGDSDKVRVGDTCMAVGCPYSLEYTDSAALGIISSTQREISYDGKTLTVMQTDAARIAIEITLFFITKISI